MRAHLRDGGSATLGQSAAAIELIGVPEEPPRLTTGLAGAIVRLIRNSEGSSLDNAVEIDGSCPPSALAS